jgi:hypothetical protein
VVAGEGVVCVGKKCSALSILTISPERATNSKEVSLNVQDIVYVLEREVPSDQVEGEVLALSELLAQVEHEQRFIVVRERILER